MNWDLAHTAKFAGLMALYAYVTFEFAPRMIGSCELGVPAGAIASYAAYEAYGKGFIEN